jgi:hypothetical protein
VSSGDLVRGSGAGARQWGAPAQSPATTGPSSLADILERVLDKGIVIAGDIQINLLDIELLTIKLRLLVASVDRAREMGINWWESDSSLTSSAKELEDENRDLRERLERLEEKVLPAGGERLERLEEKAGLSDDAEREGRSESRGDKRS